MRNFLRIATNVNVVPLLLQLYKYPDIWDQDNVRRTWSENSPHKDVSDVLLRFSDTSAPDIGDQLQCDWTAISIQMPSAKDVCFALMNTVRGEQLGRVMITRLPPGKKITPHADVVGKYANFYTRYLLALIADAGTSFSCGDEAVFMQPGDVWWFNAHLSHAVVNNSMRDRLTLIVDIRT